MYIHTERCAVCGQRIIEERYDAWPVWAVIVVAGILAFMFAVAVLAAHFPALFAQ